MQGYVLPGTLTVSATDANVGDHLFIRWIGEYPPFSPLTRQLAPDEEKKSADGSPVHAVSMVPVGCLNLSRDVPQHPVTALISDRGFTATGSSSEDLLTGLAPGALHAEAHWVINLDCQ